MDILLILALVVIAIWGVCFLLYKSKDVNKNGIPDKVDDVIDVAKERIVRVKEEFVDVKSSIKDAGKQIGDVIEAGVKKTNRKGRKPKVD
jgi:beta-lactam-binding protein with PASTA domain